MKNTLLVAFLWLSVCMVQAQDTVHYFNKTYWADTMNLLTPIGVATNNGYYLIGNCISISQTSVFVMKTDLAGNQEWWVNVDVKGNEDISSLQLGTEAIITKDSCIAFVYTKRVFGNGLLYDNYLVKIGFDGAIIWNKQQIGYGTEQAFQLIQTHDGGYALFGGQTLDDTTKYYLVKTDTAGVEQWHQSYMLDDYSKGFSIQQTADHGYIMGGYGYSNITGYDTYIVKTDSVGGVLWTTNFGGAYNDCAGTVNLLANNQYLITSCDYLENNIDWYMKLTKLNSNGQIIWDSTYYSNYALKDIEIPVIFLPDSSFVALVFYQATNNPSNLLVRFDLQGNIIWQHEYTSNPEQQVYLKDLRRTPDGGFIMAGYEYTSTPQKGYLVKVDSLGRSCSWVGCDSVGYVYPIGIEEQVSPSSKGKLWSVFPNPAQQYINLIWHNVALLPANTPCYIYSLDGALVKTVLINGTTRIDVSQLRAGIYYCKLLGMQQVEKLIIVK